MNRSQSSAGSLSPSRSPNHTLNRASSPAMRASLQSPLQAMALEQAVATELMLAMDSKRLTVLKRDWAALTDGFAHSLGIDDFLYLISRHTAPIPHVAARPQAVLIAALTELFHEIDSACANCGMIAWSDFSRQLMHAAQAGDSAYTKARGRLGPRSSRPLCRPLPLLPHTRACLLPLRPHRSTAPCAHPSAAAAEVRTPVALPPSTPSRAVMAWAGQGRGLGRFRPAHARGHRRRPRGRPRRPCPDAGRCARWLQEPSPLGSALGRKRSDPRWEGLG